MSTFKSLKAQSIDMTVYGKEFSTGSKGWFGSGKIAVDNDVCQATVNCVIVGSKDSEKISGWALPSAEITFTGTPTVFSTLSIGYAFNGKLVINERLCQVSANVVITNSGKYMTAEERAEREAIRADKVAAREAKQAAAAGPVSKEDWEAFTAWKRQQAAAGTVARESQDKVLQDKADAAKGTPVAGVKAPTSNGHK